MSCADVQTIKAGDGSKLQFSFDFPYIFKSEIHVYLWNATTKEWDEKLTTDATYPWQVTDANPTIVEFTSTAPPAPAAAVDPNEETVDNVKIRRITNLEDIRALFNPGSAIRSDDLNNNFEQLRYAIQESNCQGVTDDVYQYLLDNYWDRFDNTVYSTETWRSDNATIATTAAMDARFQDEATETITSSETWPDDDDTIATTAAIDNRIDTAITNDIGTDGTGITVTDDGDGTITLGLADDSIDFAKIQNVDIINQAEERAGSPSAADTNLYTALAANTRFDTIVQTATPTRTDYAVGKTWLQNDDDLTLSVWNGSGWTAVTSGGTFTSLSKVVYVDANNGNDTSEGHRISNPKKTIRAAIQQINAETDAVGNGSVVVVAPGIYAETFPIDIEKNDVSIVGTSLRNCIIHPAIPADDQAGYDVNVPETNELSTMFRVNSGSYFQNLTLTGMKASGTRGGSGSLYENTTYGLPVNQGWNFAFLPGATIRKSPYIQNCTNFSDSQINNVTFTPHTPGEGAAGDNDSAPTGGGILVDGSVPAEDSPLRSMVCDSYTHTALDGPGIFVTNNGYIQATSSYAFFNHAHITCINGGQANLAASTTDFGRYGLVADGRSPQAIFTSNVDGAANSGATTFNINAPTASTDLYNEAGTDNDNDWFGSATRPQSNMLVEVNSVTYPVLSATANTDSEGNAGWTVTISRPDPNNRSNNLGLNGALTDDAAVSFFLRSQIASSGHTMEYVGSGTDYRALPENGGVPDEDDQKIELNNGKIWAATTDHNGKFTLGGNQTDDPFFEVDQQAGFVTIPEGSIAFNLLSDETPQLGGDLDVNGNEITSASNGNVVINPNGTGVISLDADVGIGTTNPGSADLAIVHPRDATNFARASIGQNVDGQGSNGGNHLGLWYGNNNSDRADIFTSAGNMNFWVDGAADGTGQFSFGRTFNTTWMTIDDSGQVGVGTTSPFYALHAVGTIAANDSGSNTDIRLIPGNAQASYSINNNAGQHIFVSGANERLRIDSSGRLLVGTNTDIADTGTALLQAAWTGGGGLILARNDTSVTEGNDLGYIKFMGNDTTSNTYRNLGLIQVEADGTHAAGDNPTRMLFWTTADGAEDPTERMRIDSQGKLFTDRTVTSTTGSHPAVEINTTSTGTAADSFATGIDFQTEGTTRNRLAVTTNNNWIFYRDSGSNEALRIDSSGRVGVGTSSPVSRLDLSGGADGTLGAITFAQGNGTNKVAQVIGTSSNTNEKGIAINTYHYADVNAVRITSDGKVGIGTTQAQHSLSLLQGNALGWVSGAGNAKQKIEATGSDGLDFYTGGTPTLKATLDASGRLLVGTSTARTNLLNSTFSSQLQVEGTGHDNSSVSMVRNSANSGAPYFNIGKSRGTSAGSSTVVQSGDGLGVISFQGADGSEMVEAAAIIAQVDGTPGSNDMPGRLVFSTTADGASSPTERMRISRDGQVWIGKTSSGLSVTGHQIFSDGSLYHTTDTTAALYINRQGNDGTLVDFRQAASSEGSISVSGSTVSYNGAHLSRWSQLPGGVERTKILRGSVLSNIDEMCEWGEEENEQLNRMKVSDVEGDKNVSGVFQAWDDDDDTYTNDFYCAMTGDFVIRIAQGVTVERGDLLMSAGDGTAKPQEDDIIRSKTIAKVTSTNVSCTYDDGSYCVPCVLMAC